MPRFSVINDPSEIRLGDQWVLAAKFKSKDRIVDVKGKAVGSDYRGRQYQIIEKREHVFSTSECFLRRVIGIVIVICTFFFALLSKSVRNLFKPKENIRFGVLVSPSSNPLQKTKHLEHISLYKALKEAMEKNKSTLYVTDQTGEHQETLLRILGEGGSKKAIQISEGRALILPNMDVDPIEGVAKRWNRMVLEEVRMSKILHELGLLSPLSKQVGVTFTESSEHVIPAYISETFESLNRKGWYIIDTKIIKNSTWKHGKNFLFQSKEERLNEKNWDLVFDSVLTDIAKICFYDIPVGGDSLNIAIVKKPSDSTVCQHEVRYFGFDFSSKSNPLIIPDIENRPSSSPKSKIEDIKWLLDRIIDNIFFFEFGQGYDFGPETANLIKLKDQLVQRYIKDVVERMDELTLKRTD